MMNAKEQIEKNTTEYDEARLEEALDILVQCGRWIKRKVIVGSWPP